MPVTKQQAYDEYEEVRATGERYIWNDSPKEPWDEACRAYVVELKADAHLQFTSANLALQEFLAQNPDPASQRAVAKAAISPFSQLVSSALLGPVAGAASGIVLNLKDLLASPSTQKVGRVWMICVAREADLMARVDVALARKVNVADVVSAMAVISHIGDAADDLQDALRSIRLG